MSRPTKFTPGACAELAEWFRNYQRVGTFAEKARELGVSEQTLRNAIDRGLGKDDGNMRQKLSDTDASQSANEWLSRYSRSTSST